MNAKSHVGLAQHSAVHMCIDSTSPRFEKLPALTPPRSVTFVEIGLCVQCSSSLCDFMRNVESAVKEDKSKGQLRQFLLKYLQSQTFYGLSIYIAYLCNRGLVEPCTIELVFSSYRKNIICIVVVDFETASNH